MKTLEVGVWYQFDTGISISKMKRDNFLALPEWITQRSTKLRIKKKGVINHLRKLFPTHHLVAVGELTEDDTWEDNTEYKAGARWRLDANTRGLVWKEGISDKIPDYVLAVKYDNKTLIGLRNTYWTFDNASATEQSAEVVTGLFKSLNYSPKIKKFQDGVIHTSLSFACKYDAPDIFGDNGLWTDPEDDEVYFDEYKRSQTQLAILKYLDTIKAVDDLLDETGYDGSFDATFISALFLYHMKKGVFGDNIKHMLTVLAGNAKDENGDVINPNYGKKGKQNATSWIARENTRSQQFPIVIMERGKHAGYNDGLPFFCYWFDIAETRGLKHKQNQGAQGGYRNWFENTFLKKQRVTDVLEKAFVNS